MKSHHIRFTYLDLVLTDSRVKIIHIYTANIYTMMTNMTSITIVIKYKVDYRIPITIQYLVLTLVISKGQELQD